MKFDAERAEHLFGAPKLLIENTWNTDHYGAKQYFDLEIAGERLGQLAVVARASDGSLDKISLSVLMASGDQRGRFRIYGLDLKPTSPHQNPFKAGDPDGGRLIRPGVCHEHDFRDRITDERPDAFARPLTQKLSGFDQAIAYLCNKINAKLPETLTPPPTQGTLF